MLQISKGEMRVGRRRSSKTRRAVWAALLGVMTMAPSAMLRAQRTVDPPNEVCSWENMKQATTVDGFDFQAYKDMESGRACLEIRRGWLKGEVLFRLAAESFGEFRLGQPADAEHNIPKIENGTDITGRGRPEMIVTSWSGGAQCCFVHMIFEMKPDLRLVARLDDGDGGAAHFEDLDGDGHYYYKGNDWTFAYWDASFEDSPAPAVLLRFEDDAKGGGFHLAMDKMRSPEPTAEQWKNAIQEASDAFAEGSGVGDGVGSKVWSNMLNLIYTGHSKLAWKLFDETWPAQKKGKDSFLSGFCSQLKTSQYWADLEKTVGGAPPACSDAKPARAQK